MKEKFVPFAAGIGKSTLLNLIGGTLEPTIGHITRNPKVQTQPKPQPSLTAAVQSPLISHICT
jgi:ABC-type nitrate/sulfonate/bicarbonate transport system ATPase subunit